MSEPTPIDDLVGHLLQSWAIRIYLLAVGITCIGVAVASVLIIQYLYKL
jgi:hypothetical protein